MGHQPTDESFMSGLSLSLRQSFSGHIYLHVGVSLLLLSLYYLPRSLHMGVSVIFLLLLFDALCYCSCLVFIEQGRDCLIKKIFSLFLNQNMLSVGDAVCTQKNCLSEMVILSTHNRCFNWWIRKHSHVYAQFFFIYIDLWLLYSFRSC